MAGRPTLRLSPLLLLLLAGPLASSPVRASSGLVETVNAIRADGCGSRAAAAIPLRPNRALDRAAERLARGGKLKKAISDSGYRAMQSAMLEVTGSSDAAMARALAGRGCEDIADPVYRDVGTATRPGSAWIVLAAPLVPPSAGEAGSVSQRVLQLVNEARAASRRCGWKKFRAASPLVRSEALDRAALTHARDMATRSSLSHAGGDGSTPAVRASRAGYRWRFVGENIAAGQPTPERVVAGWLKSAGHCANIMDPDYAEMGIAFAAEPRSEKLIYWSQVFGAPAR